MPSLRRLSVLALVLLSLGAWAQTPKKKKAKKAPPPPPAAVTQVEVKLVLDGGQDRVGACILEGADDGPLNQVVLAKVTLNGVGQVMAASATLVPANAQASKTRECIEAVLKALPYPKSGGSPLVTVEREWTFKTE